MDRWEPNVTVIDLLGRVRWEHEQPISQLWLTTRALRRLLKRTSPWPLLGQRPARAGWAPLAQWTGRVRWWTFAFTPSTFCSLTGTSAS